MDRDTGRPKGFGFCEYYDKATAESAHRNLSNTDFHGRSIRIDFAEELSGKSRGGERERGGEQPRAALQAHGCGDGSATAAHWCKFASPQRAKALLTRLALRCRRPPAPPACDSVHQATAARRRRCWAATAGRR